MSIPTTTTPTTHKPPLLYPPPVEIPPPPTPTTPNYDYSPQTHRNPVLRGLPLTILSHLCASFPPLQQLLYHNAGFPQLRTLDVSAPASSSSSSSPDGVLRGYAPRWDPTVVPSNEWVGEGVGGKALREKVGRCLPSAEMYAEAYLQGKTDPVQVAEFLLAVVERGKSVDRRGWETAWVSVNREEVLRRAEESRRRWLVERGRWLRRKEGGGGGVDGDGDGDEGEEGVRWVELGRGRRGCVDGVFIGVKDEILVQNHPTTYGTGHPFRNLPNESSWPVQQLLNHGAIVLGTNTMHQFGLDTTSNNPVMGCPINPYAEEFYPGGSSGGGGSAVGCGVVPIAVATDGGGSVRIPAAYCGVYGLKTGHGRVSAMPLPSDCVSTCTIGPIAATMHDLELAYRIMATPNPNDPTNAHFPPTLPSTPPPHPHPALPAPRKKYIGIYPSWNADTPPAIHSMLSTFLHHLTHTQGYTIIPLTLPYLPYAQLSHALTILSEITSGFIQGLSAPHNTRLLTPANRVLVGLGAAVCARDLLAAQKVRAMVMGHLAFLFRMYPGLVVVTPTLADPLGTGRIGGAGGGGGGGGVEEVRVGGSGVSDANASLRSMQYVFLANLAGCPAVSVPVGYVPIPNPADGSVEGLERMSLGVYRHEEEEDGAVGGTGGVGDGSSSKRRGKVLPVGVMGMAEWGWEEELLRFGYEAEEYLHEMPGKRERCVPPAFVDVLGKCGAGPDEGGVGGSV